ncbi:MAG: dipeptide ABC transporter permease DppC, partial [Burkholderiales bacterium]
MSTAPLKTVNPPAPPHPLREFWNYFSANHGALMGLIIVVGVLLVA